MALTLTSLLSADDRSWEGLSCVGLGLLFVTGLAKGFCTGLDLAFLLTAGMQTTGLPHDFETLELGSGIESQTELLYGL